MPSTEIKRLVQKTFKKIMAAEYATKYRPDNKPYAMDEFINEFRIEFKEKVIDYVINHMDPYFKNKIEIHPEIMRELVEVIDIGNESLKPNKETSGLAKIIANHYLETIARLRRECFDAKSNRNPDERCLIAIENYLKYTDLIREYTCISRSVCEAKTMINEAYIR